METRARPISPHQSSIVVGATERVLNTRTHQPAVQTGGVNTAATQDSPIATTISQMGVKPISEPTQATAVAACAHARHNETQPPLASQERAPSHVFLDSQIATTTIPTGVKSISITTQTTAANVGWHAQRGPMLHRYVLVAGAQLRAALVTTIVITKTTTVVNAVVEATVMAEAATITTANDFLPAAFF
ncbi:MAG: hypothetical protein N2515_02545 [Deltaproteobacteria bacterium]|nr:hypothetical protein [Deltaproteobacteria bacterium]